MADPFYCCESVVERFPRNTCSNCESFEIISFLKTKWPLFFSHRNTVKLICAINFRLRLRTIGSLMNSKNSRKNSLNGRRPLTKIFFLVPHHCQASNYTELWWTAHGVRTPKWKQCTPRAIINVHCNQICCRWMWCESVIRGEALKRSAATQRNAIAKISIWKQTEMCSIYKLKYE